MKASEGYRPKGHKWVCTSPAFEGSEKMKTKEWLIIAVVALVGFYLWQKAQATALAQQQAAAAANQGDNYAEDGLSVLSSVLDNF